MRRRVVQSPSSALILKPPLFFKPYPPLRAEAASVFLPGSVPAAARASASTCSVSFIILCSSELVRDKAACSRTPISHAISQSLQITMELKYLDPFLMLDEFSVSSPAGFPDHPHRGFETVTYMLQGAFTHQDFAGHRGTIKAGDLQWMTAGRGIIHSEMPAGEGVQRGLQHWINLPSNEKMQSTFFDLIVAANYLNIRSLLDLMCQTVANMIKGKTPEEIRKTFNIENDFTPQEEEENQ